MYFVIYGISKKSFLEKIIFDPKPGLKHTNIKNQPSQQTKNPKTVQKTKSKQTKNLKPHKQKNKQKNTAKMFLSTPEICTCKPAYETGYS